MFIGVKILDMHFLLSSVHVFDIWPSFTPQGFQLK